MKISITVVNIRVWVSAAVNIRFGLVQQSILGLG